MKIRQAAIAVTLPIEIVPHFDEFVCAILNGKPLGAIGPIDAEPGIPEQIVDSVRAAVDWSDER